MIHLVRAALIFSCAIVMVGSPGCSGPTASGLSASPQRPSSFHRIIRPNAVHKRTDLVYVSDSLSNVYIYSYPSGELVDKITGLNGPAGECVDRSGDVWVALTGSNEIVEYAHGATEPISTLSDPGSPIGCAVDPVTGNLAVTGSTIEIYPLAQGSPTSYSSSDFEGYYYCTYDGSGNLFAESPHQTGMIAELAYGGSALQPVTLSENVSPSSMQWDGSYISIIGELPSSIHVDHGGGGAKGPVHVYRIAVSGSAGTIVSASSLKSPDGKHVGDLVQYWITGAAIIGPGFYAQGKEGLLTWRYPRGGDAIQKLSAPWGPWGVALSPGQ